MGLYTLDGKKPVPCKDVLKWAEWFEKAKRHVAWTEIGKVQISTVFLGVDHNFLEGPKPVLFETMVFGGRLDSNQKRYHTWTEAERGHKNMVKLVRASLKKRRR